MNTGNTRGAVWIFQHKYFAFVHAGLAVQYRQELSGTVTIGSPPVLLE